MVKKARTARSATVKQPRKLRTRARTVTLRPSTTQPGEFGVDFRSVRRYLTQYENDCFYEGAAYTARRDPAEGQHRAWPGVRGRAYRPWRVSPPAPRTS